MKKIITLWLILGSAFASAESVLSSIHSVVKIDETFVIRFESGRVAFSDAHPETYSQGDIVEAKLDKKLNLVSMKILKKNGQASNAEAFIQLAPPPAFVPTIIPGLDEATKIFNRLNNNYKRGSECFNRAHIWANDEYKKNNIMSEKVFVFFTDSYIKRNKFKWWFHVAPLLSVQEGNKVEKRVLDYMFNRRPLTIKEWTDQLVFSKRDCRPTTIFSEYWVNDQTQDCFLMVDSMYYWMPSDFKNREEQGIYQSNWNQGELTSAYTQAFQ